MNKQDRHMLNRLLENDLSPEDRAQALQRLEKDTEAIRYLAQQAVFLSELNEWLSCQNIRDTLASKGFRPQSAHAMNKKQWWLGVLSPRRLLAGAAAVIVLAIGGLFLVNDVKPDDRVVAEIVETDTDLSRALWPVGQNKVVQEIKFESGRMRLRLKNGVKLSLEGPVHATFVSAMQLRLMKGKAMADVGKDGKGFVIETVNARVVDLGTCFGVSVGESNETDVVVFEGKVEVFDPGEKPPNAQPEITLLAGEAIRMDNTRKSKRLNMVEIGGDYRGQPAARPIHIIRDIYDNIPAGETPRFYGLIQGGMGEGVRAYTTGHTRKWHAWPGETFPEELIGADVICTYDGDRFEENLEITLLIEKSCTLYLFADARQPIPAWLERDFTLTPLKLRSGPWVNRGIKMDTTSPDEEEGTYVPYSVWKRTLLQPGPVVLGAPCMPGHDIKQVMYGLAVKELSR